MKRPTAPTAWSEDMHRKQPIQVHAHHGFKLTFANKWRVSVAFGDHNYGSHYEGSGTSYGPIKRLAVWGSECAEVWCWKDSGPDEGHALTEDPYGYLSADQVAEYLAIVQSLPEGLGWQECRRRFLDAWQDLQEARKCQKERDYEG